MQLEPSEISALIGVRELIDEASRHVHDRSTGGRHTAVVLLDGAAEATIAVCLGHFGDSSAEKDTLASLHGRLEKHLGGKHGIEGWHAVSRLRRARNLAQHHQIPIDSNTLQTLQPNVVRYIDGAVRLTFDVRLIDVVLSDSVESPTLRETLEAAQEAIDAADAADAMKALVRARRAMNADWINTPRADPFDPIVKAIAQRVDPLQKVIEALPFVGDVAEYVWFERVIKSATPTVDEAHRALQFMVTWIGRFEAYDATHSELIARDRAPHVFPPSSHPDGTPHWDGPRPSTTCLTNQESRSTDRSELALQGRTT